MTDQPSAWYSPSRRLIFTEVKAVRSASGVRYYPMDTFFRDQDGKLPDDAIPLNAAPPPEPASPAPSGAGEVDDEVIERAARAGAEMLYPGDFSWTASRENLRELWRDVARAVLAAAQPAPTVSDTAAVLAGLVESMRAKANHYRRHWHSVARYNTPAQDGVEACIALVEAAQAATGARATGGESEVVTASDVRAANEAWAEFTVGEKYELRMQYGDDPKASFVAAFLNRTATSPPAPSAPGVAELLAECRWRLDEGVGQPFTPSEILHYLAPSGADAQCSCTPHPYGDGPEIDCPVHGLPPAALHYVDLYQEARGEIAKLRGWNGHLHRALATITAEDDQRPSDVTMTQVLDAIIETWPSTRPAASPSGADGTEAGT